MQINISRNYIISKILQKKTQYTPQYRLTRKYRGAPRLKGPGSWNWKRSRPTMDRCVIYLSRRWFDIDFTSIHHSVCHRRSVFLFTKAPRSERQIVERSSSRNPITKRAVERRKKKSNAESLLLPNCCVRIV